MLGNIVRDNNPDIGNITDLSMSSAKTNLALDTPQMLLQQSGSSLPAGLYYIEGYVQMDSSPNNMYVDPFIEYGGGWGAQQYNKVTAGDLFARSTNIIIKHDGSTNINLYVYCSRSTQTNPYTINVAAMRIIRIG